MIAELQETLAALREIRDSQKGWHDSTEETGLIKSAEGLECFFTPYLLLQKKIDEVDPNTQLITLDPNTIITDLDDIVDNVEKIGWAPTPYMDLQFGAIFPDGYQPKVTDSTDAVSFVVTTIIDGLNYFEQLHGPLPQDKQSRYINTVLEGTKWLQQNAFIVKSATERAFWTSGQLESDSDRLASMYFTYTAVVAIDAVLTETRYLPTLAPEKEELKELIRKSYHWLESCVVLDSDGFASVPGLGGTEAIDPQALLTYVLPICQAAQELIDPDRLVPFLLPAVRTLVAVYQKDRIILEGGNHNIVVSINRRQRRIPYEDRTLKYVLMEGLCWAYEYLDEHPSPDSERGNLIEDSKFTIEEMRQEVLGRRSTATQTWDGASFEIYLNQRAIEAISSYMQIFGVEPWLEEDAALILSKSQVADAVRDSFRRIEGELSQTIWSQLQVKGRVLPRTVQQRNPGGLEELRNKINADQSLEQASGEHSDEVEDGQNH